MAHGTAVGFRPLPIHHSHRPLAITDCHGAQRGPDFTLPDLGENVSAGDVLRLLVKPGDTLTMDQPVLELETDKATIEVPSSVAGTVGEIKVKQGDKVKVGQVILTVTESGGSKAGRQEGSKAETQGGMAEGQQGKAEGQQGKAEGQQGAVGANSAAKVPDDEPGLEQHVEGNRRDTDDKAGTTRGTRDAAADSLPSAAASAQQARPAPSRQSGNV